LEILPVIEQLQPNPINKRKMKMKTTILRLRLRPAGPNLYRLRNHSTVPTHPEKKLTEDPRLKELGRTLSDEFSTIRENYSRFLA
jgi:hypothetical protein